MTSSLTPSRRSSTASMRSSMRGQREELVGEEEEEEQEDCVEVSEDAAEAHRQVLEMSATIEILTRDFENLQRELLDAYKKLQEYSEHDPRLHPNRQGTVSPSKIGSTISGGILSNAMAKLRSGNYDGCGCSHEAEVHELQQIVSVKDTALTEAVHERNDYKLRLERAESTIRELQCGGDSDRRRTSSRSGSLHIQTSSRTSSFSGGSVPYGMTSTSPVHLTPSVIMSSTATSMSSGSSNRELPKHERFDHESSYQSKEDDELFWRRQYRDAVRMRKHQGQPAGSATMGGGAGGAGGTANARPSLKIFSYPNSHRQKGITDENVPFTRYIGISTRQNEIIKEQHRLLS